MTKLTSVVAASVEHGRDNHPISSVLADAYVCVSTRTTKNVLDIQAVPVKGIHSLMPDLGRCYLVTDWDDSTLVSTRGVGLTR